jgi:putative DNA primase/helicase
MSEQAVRDALTAPVSTAYPGGSCGADTDINLCLADHPRNDSGNAARLIARHGSELRFVRDAGWFYWTGTHWQQRGADHKARLFAADTAAMIIVEAQAMQAEGPRVDASGEEEKLGDWRKRTVDLFKWSITSGNRPKIDAMLVVAEPHLAIEPGDLDADPMVLNLRNGTLRLEGACQNLRPHDRSDLLAKIVNVDFDPDAPCPRFMKFLHRVQPNSDVRLFLQEFAGYSLTGDTSEQKLVFNYGTGANGKSTFVNVVARILGPYAVSLPFACFTHDDRRRGSDATPDLARLPGARLVRASEPEKGSRLAETSIKAITGGEEITARHLNRGFFDFDPQFKMMISGNHKPSIRGQDEGIWRRMLLVPWEIAIPPDERDRELDAILWEERAGILNWLLDGCRLWLDRGLTVPDAVRAATDQYRSDSDPIGRFLDECVSDAPGETVPASVMYSAYQTWCAANAERAWTQNGFGRSLRDRGLSKRKSCGVLLYCDISIATAPGAEDVQ